MFYCDNCAEKYKYPESFSKSMGKCECCEVKGVCNDVPSSMLPKPPKFEYGLEISIKRKK